MRKTLALVLATAFVATLPSLASAKTKRHHRRAAPPVEVVDSNVSGPRLMGDALHQLIVPFQVTFGSGPEYVDPPVRRRLRARHRRARAGAPS